ncbi:hypothetical protein HNP86_001885 [Methanococcus maripaludis]|uniref:Uncharacterized protein n=1 Tax=Methanococcus maripaludis TaxID=39152 RepID=A0A7J9P122_METMI|nr:hypothetical protein [Methanococcus maripaludis]MBA2851726.1 hypothetical protein [Methanococcus maripaludis]
MTYKTLMRAMIPTVQDVIHTSTGTTLTAGVFITSVPRNGGEYNGDKVWLYILDVGETIGSVDLEAATLMYLEFTEPDTDVTNGTVTLGPGQALAGKCLNGTCNIILGGLEK